MRKVESLRCTFCELQCENIYHLFYDCVKVRSVWKYVAESCTKLCNYVIHFNCKDVILEYVNDNVNSEKVLIINMVILYTKWYIMKCKFDLKHPTIHGLQRYLEGQGLIESQLVNILLQL